MARTGHERQTELIRQVERLVDRVEQLVERAETPDRIAYSLEEAAEALGVSERLLRRLIKAGDFPAARLGGRLVVPVEEVRQYMAMRTSNSVWTPAAVVQEIRKLAGALGEPLSSVDVPGRLVNAARRAFGTWEAACHAAGVTASTELRGRQPEDVVAKRLEELRADPELRRRLWLLVEGYLRYGEWPDRGSGSPFARLEEVVTDGDHP